LCKPPWSPPLPVSETEIWEMQNEEPLRVHFVGDYARSLACLIWDFRIHPSFYDWCCNFVAWRPDFLPLVPELKLRPKKLPGCRFRRLVFDPRRGVIPRPRLPAMVSGIVQSPNARGRPPRRSGRALRRHCKRGRPGKGRGR
jgi:hypothetical protein